MASNIQRGTRRMDASDWVRIKKLRGAVNFLTDQPRDVTNPQGPSCCAIGEYNRMRRAEFGTSKIRRPASNWIDYKASQSADYTLESMNGTAGKTILSVKVCNCVATNIS